MKTFALATEGISDQVVIKYILAGYFNNFDLDVRILQPLYDATDQNRGLSIGGWGNLINYCKSDAFKSAFETNDYVIIQIDTDVCSEYGVSTKEDGEDLNCQKLIEKVILAIISWIGQEVYNLVADRIIFAVAVDSIECWLLPIYYTDNKKGKTTGCLNALNIELLKKEGFSIHAKEPKYYEKIAKKFMKRKDLDKYYPHNPSFKLFIQHLDSYNIDIG
jgi:hypothetical protein